MVSTLQHLFLDIQGDNQDTKPGEEPIHRILTLHNRGDRAAYLELWVETTDQRSAGIVQWVTFDKSESELTLAPHQSLDVTLTITVPLQAEAGFYGYDIRLRSSQYPGEEVQRNQQLHILPSDQEARLRSEPHLTVTPVTDSDHPHVLKSGATLDLTLTIDNPSRRTDRFFLHCDNLPLDWYTIQYPEGDAAVPGVITFTDGLQLNPRESGQITMAIHPPQYSPAGSYYPTLRLTSRARPEITLLKIVYFTLAADERLAVELMPKTLAIPLKDRYFEVLVHNRGNLERQLVFQGRDPDRRLHYRLQPARLRLVPGEETNLQLVVNPRHWWQKIWRLRDRTVEFELLVENAIASAYEPALPQPLPTGTVNLKARRRWLFWLLLLSTATTALLGLLALAWHMFVWRPSLVPKIASFSTTQETYQEGKPEPISFSWEITNPKKIGQIVLTKDGVRILWLSRVFGDLENILDEDPNPDGISRQSLTPMLRDNANCSLETTVNKNSPLTILLRIYRRARQLTPDPEYFKCRAVMPADFQTADAQFSKDEIAALNALAKPTEGSYEFKLEVYMDQDNPDDEADLPAEPEDNPDSKTASEGIVSRVKRILGLGNPETLQLADTAVLEKVAIAAADPPEILEFNATQSDYRTVSLSTVLADVSPADVSPAGATLSAAVNQVSTSAELSNRDDAVALAETTAETDPQLVPVKLGWQISNPDDIQELRLTSLSPDGAENTEAVSYPILDKNVEQRLLDLEDYCDIIKSTPDTVVGPDILVCKDVPTQATQVGDYVFYLTVVTRDGTEESPILKTTPTISIKPPEPAIVDFSVNGKSVEQTPRRVYVLNPARGKIDIALSWDVKYATEVELLPAPGKVVKRVDEMVYTLSAAPGAETITLRGVNELEEEITRSVIIEKVAFESGAQPIPLQSSRPSSRADTETAPEGLPLLPPPPDVLPVPELAPIRTPPQAN